MELRGVIAKNPVALAKWNVVKDDLISYPPDRNRIRQLLTDGQYEEGIKVTIELWANKEPRNLGDLTAIFRTHDLNFLAG